MKLPRSSVMKFLVYGAAFFVLLVATIIAWISIALIVSGSHDKQNVQAAVVEITLPAPYHLVSSVYDNHRCLDVCPHTVLTYKSSDGSKLNEEPVVNELESLGYKYDGYGYSKILKQKLIHVTVRILPAQDSLTIDVSL